jgi:hypothetical protein
MSHERTVGQLAPSPLPGVSYRPPSAMYCCTRLVGCDCRGCSPSPIRRTRSSTRACRRRDRATPPAQTATRQHPRPSRWCGFDSDHRLDSEVSSEADVALAVGLDPLATPPSAGSPARTPVEATTSANADRYRHAAEHLDICRALWDDGPASPARSVAGSLLAARLAGEFYDVAARPSVPTSTQGQPVLLHTASPMTAATSRPVTPRPASRATSRSTPSSAWPPAGSGWQTRVADAPGWLRGDRLRCSLQGLSAADTRPKHLPAQVDAGSTARRSRTETTCSSKPR